MIPLLLQQFARFPRPGQVKTRLQSELSADEACQVHCELMTTVCSDLLAADLGPVELWLDEAGEHPAIDACERAGISELRQQPRGDLGQRMAQALVDGLGRAHKVLLVGSDCPGLDADYLAAAQETLDGADIVFGPAEDGGFVLIGARRITITLFDDLVWGDSTVLERCEARVEQGGMRAARLAPRFDVDTPEDLRRWRGSAPQPVIQA